MKFFIIIAIGFQLLLSANSSIKIEPIVVEAEPIVSDHKSKYSKEDLEMTNVESLDDLGSMVPSLSISNYGSRNLAFTSYRGQTNSMSTDSPIAVYIDDIPLSFVNTFLAHELYNISGVSVLKGPQGFNTGLGAEAGIIKLKIDDSLVKNSQVDTQVGIANYGEKSISLHAKSPIDNGLISVDALYKERDGFTKNDYTGNSVDGEKTKAISMRMLKNIGDFRVTLLGMYDVLDDGGTPYNADRSNPFVMNQNIDGYIKQKSLLGSIKLEYIANDFSMKSITSLQNHNTKDLLDGDRTTENSLTVHSDENFKEVNEELSFQLQKNDWELLGGAFFAYEYEHTYVEHYDYEYAGLNGYRTWQKSQPEKKFALFSQLEVDITKNFTLTAGLRYIWNQKEYDSQITKIFPFEIPEYGFVNTAYPQVVIHKEWQKLLPKLKLEYQVDSANLIFFQYAQGFKNGGYNYDEYTPTAPAYDSEESQTLELGFNSNANSSLSINGSLYATFVKRLQVETINPDISTYVDNADKANIYGFEGEARYAVNDNFNIHTSISIIEAKFEEYISNNTDYSGNNLIKIPKYTLALGSEYYFIKHYYLSGVLKSNGKTYFDKANSVSESSYAYADAKIGFKSKKLSWSIYANNIFDRQYLNYIVSAQGLNAYNFGEPRRIGASLSYSF